ncbi:MAG TPA: hypothetical protein VGB52_01720 [Actinomycetota bacterium]
MARYWCGWCGDASIAPPGLDVPCRRCAGEFTMLFGFTPRTSMDELAPGEEPGEPAAARKRFTFYDARTGVVIGRTAVAAQSSKRRKPGLHTDVMDGSRRGNGRPVASTE